MKIIQKENVKKTDSRFVSLQFLFDAFTSSLKHFIIILL